MPGARRPILHRADGWVIPAKVAGVSRVSMTTVPERTAGRIRSSCRVPPPPPVWTKIFKTGGDRPAALAYGTQSIPAVTSIVGPGNIYAATAKRKVFGRALIHDVYPQRNSVGRRRLQPRLGGGRLLSQAERR